MGNFSPNTNLDDARRFRAGVLLAMAACSFATFGLLAAGVDDHRLLSAWDVQVKEDLHEHARANPAIRETMDWVTQLGKNRYLIVASMGVVAFLAVLRLWQLDAIWAITTLGGFKFVQILKEYYDRARPAFPDAFVFEEPGSFPSFHAGGSMMFYGMLAYLLIRATRRVGWVLMPFFASLILFIGLTRLYLGAHWLSDVLAGWVLGFGWVTLGMAAAEATREH